MLSRCTAITPPASLGLLRRQTPGAAACLRRRGS